MASPMITNCYACAAEVDVADAVEANDVTRSRPGAQPFERHFVQVHACSPKCAEVIEQGGAVCPLCTRAFHRPKAQGRPATYCTRCRPAADKVKAAEAALVRAGLPTYADLQAERDALAAEAVALREERDREGREALTAAVDVARLTEENDTMQDRITALEAEVAAERTARREAEVKAAALSARAVATAATVERLEAEVAEARQDVERLAANVARVATERDMAEGLYRSLLDTPGVMEAAAAAPVGPDVPEHSTPPCRLRSREDVDREDVEREFAAHPDLGGGQSPLRVIET